MAVASKTVPSSGQNWSARLRRFFHWLSSPHVVLSLIMLAVMVYMVIIPLYRMIITTFSVQEMDLRALPGAEVGDQTF